MRRQLVALLVSLAVSGGVVAATPAAAEPLAGQSNFVALPPVRILDTRTGVGATPGRVAPHSSIDLTVLGAGGVPSSNATAVVLNVTAADATGPGYVQVLPTGRAQIGASSNLNLEHAGQTIPNLVVVPIGDAGKVTIYTEGGTHLLADVFGYFVEAPSAVAAGRFVPVTPSRLADTRGPTLTGTIATNPGDTKNCSDFATWDEANRWFWFYFAQYGDVAKLDSNNDQFPCETTSGVPSNKVAARPLDPNRLPPRSSVRVGIRGAGPVPATGVSAVVLNVTASEGKPGYVQVIPTGGATAIGASSNLNVTPQSTNIANTVVVPVGADGSITLYSETGTHLLADVMGYFTDDTAVASTDGLFVPLRPERLLDTRNGIGAPKAKLGDEATIVVTARGAAGIPTAASAVFVNITATETTSAGYVAVTPTGETAQTSNLNLTAAGQTIPNSTFAKLSSEGKLSIYTYRGTHLLADVAGYFTAPL